MNNDIEKLLQDKKRELDVLEVPDELETRLGSALDRKKPCKRISRGAVAAILIAALMLTYSYDAIGYYGKKILGFDNVTSGSITKLNEEGRGQEINKSYTFSNGITVTLEGVMFDNKELVAFCRVKSKDIDLTGPDASLYLKLKGLKPLGYYMTGGHGEMIDKNTQMWIYTFEAPHFYEKWMSLDINLVAGGKSENGSISLTLDRNKAMRHIIKWDINKKVKIGDIDVSFDTITASRLSTVVEGKLTPVTDSAAKTFQDKLRSFPGLSIEFDIFTDGRKLQMAGSGMGSSGMEKGAAFDSKTEGLPVDTSSLQIRNVRLLESTLIDREASLGIDTKNLRLNEDLLVKNVYTEGENTCITVESKGMPVMGLFAGDKQLENLEPTAQIDSESSRVVKERVFKFKGRGDKLKLMVKTLNYAEYSDSVIDIPME